MFTRRSHPEQWLPTGERGEEGKGKKKLPSFFYASTKKIYVSWLATFSRENTVFYDIEILSESI